ncbi:Ig-like domain repeat protein [Streptomyces sp. M600PL45_2]|uniref:Ig-like domain repeat protein n=1 Tax=Streptomyces marispadix TaxID=2922868 RepID=A0ABS9SUD1_9ACTN|nr:Ig-like domain repeat protein [Streptomyces marispadix]
MQLCATVSSAAGTPTGAVTFSGPGGPLGSAILSGGQGCITVSNLTSGTVTVSYAGTSCFGASNGSTTVTVNPASTTTGVTADPNPAVCGQSVELCATVTTASPGSGTPTGSVLFSGPGGFSQSVGLVGGEGCVTVPSAAAGTYTAQYTSANPGCFSSSSGAVALAVNKAGTTTSVTATPNPAACGQPVTVCATVAPVSPGSGAPSGTVVFTGPGGLNQPVGLVGGQACFTSSSLVSGTITATYSGDQCFLNSVGTVNFQSSQQTTTVTAPPAQVRLRTNGTWVIPAMSATLTTSGGAPVAGQTITFVANAVGGPIALGSAVTNASGVATLAPPTITVPPGIVTAKSYRASFAGAACLSPSSGNGTLTVVSSPLLP